ncbi:MAG: serine/threonine protein kinase, partial [Lentisphaeria bacterium]|nr:serine/threonine protein kinase [Lentisphaeria bacterium]
LLKTGTPEEIQDFVQSGQAVSGMSAACFFWTPGLIIGKYEIIRKLGKGGMGVIYLARHTQLDTLRALKVLPAGEADEKKDFAERFIREARIASQIRHPNVVEVMDVEADPELHVSYIVMEYVDGGSLRQTLRKQDRLNLEQAIVTIQGVVSALCAAAEHGIVHRDIKPDNIMFTKRGEVKLADLGIAKKDDEDDNLTKTNVMMGTPAYLSPEQVENPKTVDIRSDIYSLGATFYEMLTGQPPYPGNSAYDILRKIFSEPVPDPRNILPEIPEEIALIVMKMLAKDPQKRYQTPEQLRDALAKIIPALSDTNMQGIVRGIIAGTGEFKTENSGSQSVISATLYELRKRERYRVFMYWGVCAALLIGIIAAWQMLWSKSADRDVTETVTQQSKEEAVSRESVPVLHSLRIRTVAGAALRLTAPDGQIWAYPGNAAGAFHIENLAAGRYRIELFHPEYLAYETICSVPEDDALELPLRPDVKKLTVTGVTGTRIVLHCPDGKKRTFAITDSGKVQIPDLKKGNYVLYASHEKYFSVERSLTVEKDMAIALELEKRLLNFTLTTHPGSRVELRQNARAMWAKNADAAGFCSFAAIPRGVYEVRISAPQYETHLSTVQVEKDIVAAIPLVKQLYSVAVRGVMGVKVV